VTNKCDNENAMEDDRNKWVIKGNRIKPLQNDRNKCLTASK